MATTTSKSRKGGNEKKGRSSATKTTTFSVRLSKEEKDLLKRAAEREDTTPTQFLKSAALTRAAHVDNMNTSTSFDFDALRDRIIALLYNDFPKEFLAKLTPTAEADWKRRCEKYGKEDGMKGNRPPALPIDDGNNYVAVTRNEHDFDDFVEGQAGLRPFTEDEFGVEFEQLSDPAQETKMWLSVDTCPAALRPEDWEPRFSEAPNAAPVIFDDRVRLSPEEARQLRDAVRFGGVEFIKDLLDRAQEVYKLTESTDSETSAPDPIDPDKFG